MAVLAILCTALTPGAAVAVAVPVVVIDPSYGPPLTTIKVSGNGYCSAGCGPVSIQVGSLYIADGIAVDSSGRFTTFVRIPGSVRPEATPVIASQLDAHQQIISARTNFNVTISQRAPTTYPPPSSIPPPHASPPFTTTQRHSTPPGPTSISPTSGGALPSSPSAAQSSAVQSSAHAGSSARSGGTNGGVVAGVAAGVLLIAAAAVAVVRSRRRA